ncbi:hypothetical protein DFH09DRAFT_1314358 [Mycena vulgaris]|nr:hypothetical protein DFH09DRAFT_1314358 [Mycena vulgaris]
MSNFIERLFLRAPFQHLFPRGPSPASDLPTELLLEIFLLCRPETIEYCLDDAVKSKHIEKQFPVLYVNSHWRAAALSSLPPPFLWLYLSTHRDPAVRMRTDTLIMSRLRKYLESNGTLPLSFHVLYYSSETYEFPLELLTLLCAHSARWEHVSLHLMLGMWGAIAATMQGPFPRLKSIEVSNAMPDFQPNSPPSPSFLDAPQLSALNISYVGQRHANWSLPWAQLTCVTLSFANPQIFHRVLTDCPNLRECTVKDYGSTSSSWRPPPGPPFTHAALRTLRFRNANLSHFLPLVHVPNVDEVHSDSTIYELADAEALSTLPALRKLHLRFVFFNAKQAAEYLPIVRVPELELELLGDMPEGALRALEENASLERLRLKFKKTADEGALVGLAERRGLALHVEALLSPETRESFLHHSQALPTMSNFIERLFLRAPIEHIFPRGPSPVSGLPTELLLEIFLLCRPETLKYRLDDADKSKHIEKQFPVLYVNSRWRAAALSSLPPTFLQLWLSSHRDRAVRMRTDTLIMSRLRKYLESDGTLPLSFHVHYYGSETYEFPLELLMLLCAHSTRWERAGNTSRCI